MIYDKTIIFNSESKYIKVTIITNKAFFDAFVSDIIGDGKLVGISIILVSLYCILFMGSFSPIHFRACAGCVTLFCVILSYTASSSILYYIGFQSMRIHFLLPFLLIGIGVDDMFVISAAID